MLFDSKDEKIVSSALSVSFSQLVTTNAAAGVAAAPEPVDKRLIRYNQARATSRLTFGRGVFPVGLEVSDNKLVVPTIGKQNAFYVNLGCDNAQLHHDEKGKPRSGFICQKVSLNENHFVVELICARGEKSLFLVPKDIYPAFETIGVKKSVDAALKEDFPTVKQLKIVRTFANLGLSFGFTVPRANFLIAQLDKKTLGIYELVENELVQRKKISLAEEICLISTLRANQVAVATPVTNVNKWIVHLALFDFNAMLQDENPLPYNVIPISHPKIATIKRIFLHNDGETLVCLAPSFNEKRYQLFRKIVTDFIPGDILGPTHMTLCLVNISLGRMVYATQLSADNYKLFTMLPDGGLCGVLKPFKMTPQLVSISFPEPSAKVRRIPGIIKSFIPTNELVKIATDYFGLFQHRNELDKELNSVGKLQLTRSTSDEDAALKSVATTQVKVMGS